MKHQRGDQAVFQSTIQHDLSTIINATNAATGTGGVLDTQYAYPNVLYCLEKRKKLMALHLAQPIKMNLPLMVWEKHQIWLTFGLFTIFINMKFIVAVILFLILLGRRSKRRSLSGQDR